MSVPSILWYYDVNSNSIINSDGTTSSVTTPKIFTNNNYTLKIQLYNIYPAVYDLSGVTVWKCGIGNLGGTAAPYIESLNADFNLDPWADPTNGKISIAIDSNSATMEADIGSKVFKIYYIEIRDISGANEITISLNKIYGASTVYNIL